MRSPLNWIGGKSLLVKEVLARVPEHETYCEVFSGALWVLFGKEPSRFETVNDLNSDLVSFYRVLQHHLEEFCREFKWVLSSREWWQDYDRQLAADGLTDIQRAARFFYVQRHGYGGKVAGRTFGVGPLCRPRINLVRLEETLSEAHLRLTCVNIERLHFADFLPRYDRPGTFFYLDPPYWGCEDYYGKELFKRDDFERLASILAGLKGKFLLSLNDTPEVRRCFRAFEIEPVATKYSVGDGPPKAAKELFVKNYAKAKKVHGDNSQNT